MKRTHFSELSISRFSTYIRKGLSYIYIYYVYNYHIHNHYLDYYDNCHHQNIFPEIPYIILHLTKIIEFPRTTITPRFQEIIDIACKKSRDFRSAKKKNSTMQNLILYRKFKLRNILINMISKKPEDWLCFLLLQFLTQLIEIDYIIEAIGYKDIFTTFYQCTLD